jgi:hypothetical protein
MPISIAGSGTITGISAGGLPDDCITTADIAAGAVTDAKVNASAAIADSKLSGTTCKAWVNFNGTGTVAIRASYNVSSITDNGTGDYTVNFTTALVDANYVVQACTTQVSASGDNRFNTGIKGAYNTGATLKTTTQVRVFSGFNYSTGSTDDAAELNFAIFR